MAGCREPSGWPWWCRTPAAITGAHFRIDRRPYAASVGRGYRGVRRVCRMSRTAICNRGDTCSTMTCAPPRRPGDQGRCAAGVPRARVDPCGPRTRRCTRRPPPVRQSGGRGVSRGTSTAGPPPDLGRGPAAERRPGCLLEPRRPNRTAVRGVSALPPCVTPRAAPTSRTAPPRPAAATDRPAPGASQLGTPWLHSAHSSVTGRTASRDTTSPQRHTHPAGRAGLPRTS